MSIITKAIAKRQHREANEIASKGHGVWKKFAPVLSVILAIAIAGRCVYGFVKEQNRQVLRVFNSGEYMDTNLLTKFEKEYDALVYHVIHTFTEFGELYNFLYVSDHEEEWEMENADIKDGYTFVYVWNKTDDYCSEFGGIAVKERFGGLVRIG